MLKSVYDCSVIELPRIENAKGNITPVHSGINLPFEIARIFYLYDIPEVRLAERMPIANAISSWLRRAVASRSCSMTGTTNEPSRLIGLTSVCTSRRVSGLPSKAFLRVRSAWY